MTTRIPDPEEYDQRVSSAGIDPESFSLRDYAAFDDWKTDHPEWEQWDALNLSAESQVAAWASGFTPDDVWTGLTISADGSENWSVTVTTDAGTITIPLYGGSDIAWDYYDAAAYYDIDVEKDIDTNGEIAA